MASPSLVPLISQTLSAERVDQLKKQARGVLNYIINANFITQYFLDASLLSQFRTALAAAQATSNPTHEGKGDHDCTWDTFAQNVPLSTYDDYRPYISLFTDDPCLQTRVENLLAPGLPRFIATSSGTSGGVAKFFPKYTHPEHVSQATLAVALVCGAGAGAGLGVGVGHGSVCVVFSLRYPRTTDVLDNTQGVAQRIPFCLVSAGLFRGYNGWPISDDDELVKARAPGHVTPLAAAYIKSYDTSLLTHALFALADRGVGYFNTFFITVFYDLVRLIESRWEELVEATETGRMLELDGLEGLRPHLQAYLTPRPDRAAELRTLSATRGSRGWLARVWPNLATVAGNTTGAFAAVLPRVRHHLGPSINVQNTAYGSSEAWVAVPYTPEASDGLYKVLGTDDLIEYLDVEQPDEEGAECVVQSWGVVPGKQYEVVVTTRDGLWRYRLGDVLEIAGFAPEDGAPLMRYVERRNAVMRLGNESVTEAELRRAVASLAPTAADASGVDMGVGGVTEFLVVADDRTFPRRYGFLLELDFSLQDGSEPTSIPNAWRTAPQRLHEHLRAANATYAQLIGTAPSVRIVPPGTFAAYRAWRVRLAGGGGGQVKVPTIVYDPEVREWLAARVVCELGIGPGV